MPPSPEVTELLRAWSRGEEEAREKLIPLIYEDLRQRARRQMGRERQGNTLQATALIHEAYLRLVGVAPVAWESRNHLVQALTALDQPKGRVVELRYFGGLSVEETAEVLEVSPRTVKGDWQFAKVWLLREMGGGGRDDAGPAVS